MVNYSCIPGREPQYSSWVPTALYLLGLNTLNTHPDGRCSRWGWEGQSYYYQEVFPGQHFVCVCVCVCVYGPVHVYTHVHLCAFTGVEWAACTLAVIIIEVSVILPKVPPTQPL